MAASLFSETIGGSTSDPFEEEMARLKAGPMADMAFWMPYEESLWDIGPSLAMGFLHEDSRSGWPVRENNAIVCGNVQSVMQFLSDAYDVVPGLIVDQVTWHDGDGRVVTSVPALGAGGPYRARGDCTQPFPGMARSGPSSARTRPARPRARSWARSR